MDHALGSERRLSEVSKVRMRREGTTLIQCEVPGAMWLLGAFFAGIGGSFVVSSVRGPQQDHVGPWGWEDARTLATVMGLRLRT